MRRYASALQTRLELRRHYSLGVSHREIVKSLPDATVVKVERELGALHIHLELWNQETAVIIASDVGLSSDSGTWECDALVRLHDLDQDGRMGFGVLSTDGDPTLRFNARTVELLDTRPGGTTTVLA